MVDKVKPLKMEDAGGGTELDLIPTELNPQEDYTSTKGVAFEDSDNTVVYGDTGVMRFKDADVTTPVKLQDLINKITNLEGGHSGSTYGAVAMSSLDGGNSGSF